MGRSKRNKPAKSPDNKGKASKSVADGSSSDRKGTDATARPFELEELEARILLSTFTLQDPGAAIGPDVEEQQLSAEEAAGLGSSSESSSPATFDDADEMDGATDQPADEIRRELVFIDEGVEDYDQLLNDLIAETDSDREIEVVLLSSARDGIDQISEALGGREDLDAIHFVAHGSEGAVQLGDTRLDAATLAARREDIGAWADALDVDADLLFYGCDLAGSEAGKDLVASLAELTEADVSASNDLTGSAVLGGDWDLEYSVGEVESTVAFSAEAQQSWEGVLANTGSAIWAENGSGTPETSSWDGTSFGAEGTTANVGTWRTMQGAEAPTRDEKIVVGVEEGGTSTGMMWDGSSWSSLSLGTLGTVSETYWYGVEVGYESQSGDAVLVWNDASQSSGDELRFSVWDGSSWTTPTSIAAYSGSEPQNLRLASSPNSDEMVLVVSDSSADDHVLVWNGASWGNALMLDASGTAENDQSAISVAYESQSGDAMVVYGKNGDADAYYRVWNGASWGTEATIDAPAGVTDETRWSSIASDPTTDRLVLGTMTSGSDVWLTTWDGSAWATGTVAETSTTGLIYPNLDVAFESQSGEAIAVYGESGQSVVRYRTWSEGSGWSAEQTGPILGATPNSMTLDSDPASNRIMLSVQDSGADLNMALWDGSSFGATTEHETDTGETKNQPFVFLWDRDASANQAPTDLVTTNTTVGGLQLNTDGGNDAYYVADDGSGLLGGLTTVTIEATFSVDTPGADLTPLLSYAAGTNDEELALFVKFDGSLWFGTSSNGSSLQVTTDQYTELFDGDIHHVAVSWDSSNGAVAFYVDGSLVESFTGYQTSSSIDAGGELVFGQDQDSVLGGFKTIDVFSGTIYDVRVFDDVRTAGEIASNYDQVLAPTEPGMIANWTFGDLSSTGIVTDSVSGNNLTEQHVVAAGFSASTPQLTLSIAEDAPDLTVIGSVAAVDPDAGDTFTYSLLDDAGGRFAIDAASGQISVADSSLIDFALATSHDVTIRVTDVGGLTYDELFTISVLNVNESPVITSNGGGANSAINVAENTTVVTTVTATDADLDTPIYSIDPASDDAAFFIIDSGTGALAFAAPPDFETAADLDGDNVYEVTVQVSDGNGGIDTQALSVTVTDIATNLVVTTMADLDDGDTSSAEALNASKGMDGSVSLSEAITAANNSAETVTISFNISDPLVGGVHTFVIAPGGLPAITSPVIIDATTEPDYAGTPIIELDGSSAGAGVSGLTLGAGSDGSVIRGLVINRFNQSGILVDGSDGNTISGNYVGTDSSGNVQSGSDVQATGITVNDSSGNTIGGTDPGDANVLSGNRLRGVIIVGSTSTNNVVSGNFIGTNADGSAALTNVGVGQQIGVYLYDTPNNTIGGIAADAENVISGNTTYGIYAWGANSTGNAIQGNIIGLDASLSTAIGNGNAGGGGIMLSNAPGNLIGGTTADAGNVISGHLGSGLIINAAGGTGNTVLANAIYDNASLGLDLGADGVTDNDAGDVDAGANDLQNFPIITSAALDGTDLILGGSLDTDGITTQYRIEFFGNAAGTQDATNGEARVYLGSATVTTDGSGDATFSNVTLSGVTLSTGDYVTATATKIEDAGQVGISDQLAYASTSEFAVNALITTYTAPTTSGIPDISVDENSGFGFMDLKPHFADAEDADTDLVYTIVANTNPALFNSATIVSGSTFRLDYGEDLNGTSDITIRATDTSGLFVESTFTVTVDPVNDDPIAVSDNYVAVEGIPFSSELGLNDLLLNDSDVDSGSLSVNPTPVSGPANGSLVLNADGTFVYTPNNNFNGTDSFVYEVLDGNGGSATGTATFTVQPREIRILFTTESDVNNSKVPGVSSWDAGDVLAIGDPNLSFEPAGSDGSVLPYIDLEAFSASDDMTINGLHFVSNDVTVGSGANSVDLQRGDLVFVSDANEVMTSNNSLAIQSSDVIVFRPNAVDDYSAGTFIHLLDQPGTATTTGITLIENDVLIGDVTLTSGSFLFTQESVVEESSIYHFSADEVGAGTTTGTVSTLISSVDIDVNWNQFVGVMVISEDLYLDGTMVPSGSIVTTLSGGDSFVGDNGTFVDSDEIFYLSVNTTTMGSGTTSADATVLFDGGDIGLNNNQKKIRSLAIIEEIRPADNIDPSIALAPAFVNYTEQDPPTIIGAGTTVTDPDSADFDGGLLRVDFATTGTSNDRLAIEHEGDGGGQVGISGTTVSYGGLVIGTFAGGTDGTVPLTVLFNANAGVEAVEAVTQQVTYENVSNNPSTTQRRVEFSVTDGDGGGSATVAKTIVINSVNAAPVVTGANDLVTIDEDAFNNGGTLVSDLVAGWITDTDPGALGGIAVVGVDNTNGSWEYSVDGGTTWTALGTPSTNQATLLAANPATFVRFVPNPDWNGTVTNGIIFHAWDQTSGVNGDVVDLLASDSLRDQFDTVSYANDDGSAAWTSDWIESEDNGAATSGNVRVESGRLRLDNLDGGSLESIVRSADLSDAATATLTFDYDAFGEGGLDTVAFEVSNDGGSTWTLLESMDVVGNISGSRSYDLEGFTALTADMQVRFRIVQGLDSTTQHINFDNVDIAYGGTGIGGSSAVSLATASSSITVNAINDAPAMTSWFDAAWTERKALTIDASLVAGDVVDFPVLVTLSVDPELAAEALANGDDIVFTSGDGSTQLAHEIEYFDDATGELRVWVKTDLSATVDTELYIYYGNASATNQENAAGVWSSDFVGVYHLSESPTGTVGEIVDSSGSGNHATAEGSMDASDSVSTAIGEGFAFDGVDDKLRIPDSASLDGLNDAATFSLWINWEDAADGDHQIIMTSENRFSGGDGYEWASQGDGDHFFYPDATTPDGNYNLGLNPFQNDQWHHLAVTMDYAAQEVKIYVDGNEMTFNYEGVPTQWTDLSDSGDLLWGGNPSRASRFFLGMMDEIRLADVVRSQEWLETEFNNQTNPGAFMTVGASELPLSQHALTDIDEDDFTSPGDTVLAIIESVGGDRITDADDGAVEGIAVVGVDDTNGEWQYDANADGTWIAFGSVSDSTAVLLDTDARVRFVPDPDYNGNAGILSFRAWDQTSGSNGDTSVDVSTNGNDSAFSTKTGMASLNVNPVEDAPILGNNALTISEGGTVVLSGSDLSATDAETAGGLLQFAITGVTGGQFELVAAPGAEITTFTQQQITDGDVQFVHDGGEAAPTYDVTVSDGALIDGPLAATISFTNVNDAPTAVADSDTVAEGNTVTIDLALNDSDPDDGLDLTSIQIVGAPTNGSIVVNADGTVDYTHDGSETTTDLFTYTIRDAAGAVSNTATVSLTITPQNDNPVLGNNALTISEGGTVVLTGSDLSATDAETAGGLLQFTITGVTGGQFELVAAPGTEITTFTQQQITDGDVQFVHAGGEAAPTYDVTVSDGALVDGPLAATISFTNVNDVPTAVADSDTVAEGNTVTIDVAANDTDPDDGLDLTSIVIVGAPTNGSVIVNADGTVDYTHDGSETLSDSFTYSIQDASGAVSNTATVSLTITPVDDNPVLGNNALTITEGGTVILSGADLSATDAETASGSLQFTITGVTGGQFELVAAPGTEITTFTQQQITDGDVQFVHDGGEGAPTYDVTVSDGALVDGPLAATISFTNVNDVPTAVADADSTTEGGTVTIDLALNDLDPDDGLDLTSIVIVGAPTNGSVIVNADGTVDYTHDGSETIADSFTYTIQDASGAVSNTTTVSLTITPQNDNPVLGNNALTISEGGTVVLTGADLSATDAETAGGLLQFTITGVTGGQFELVAAPGAEITTFTQQQLTDGDVQFVHAGGEAAPTYDVTVSDGALVDGPLAATISFTNVNDAPTAVADSDTVAEGNTVTIDLATNDTDPDNGLDLTSIVIVGAPTNGSVIVNADGTVDYAHDGSETISDSFTYTISDASGAVSNTTTVTLTITPQDDNPALGNNALTISEGGTVVLTGADLSATDAETASGSLQFTITGVTGGQFELVAAPGTEITTFTQQQITDGDVQFVHAGGEAAPTYDVTVSDGALVDGPLAATISFTNVNDAPTAVADSDTVAEGNTVTIDLATNDTDPDDGLDLTSIVIVGAPTNGSVIVNADGTVDYAHDGSETISDSFTYTIQDASGAVSNTTTVSLTITPQDDNPVLGNNALTISEGGTVILSGVDLSATDAETASGLLEFTVTGVTGGQFELVAAPGAEITTFTQQQLTDGDVQFAHDGGEAAPTYDVTVSDGVLIDGPLAATISFTSVNDAPTAVADSDTVAEGATVTIDLAANDTDPDNALDLTSIVIVGAPSNGSIAVNADGTVDYTHDGSETISDSFTYTIADASGAVSNTTTVTLTITPVDDNPVLGNNALTISEGGAVVLTGADLSATDAETAGGLLGFTVTGVTGGQFELVAAPGTEITTFTQQQLTDGDIQFVHDGAEAAPTYDVTVSDGALVDGPLAATISFTNVNDAPTAVVDSDTVAEGNTVTIDLAANDTDPDDGLDLTSIVIVGAPTNGSVIVNADGTVDYTHDGSETMADSFTYTIQDASGAVSNTTTVTLTITSQNDNPVLGNNALTISEGGTVVLTGADLSATDAETATGSLQFTITGVTGGQFELVAAPGAEITTFTQQQLTDGDIQFVHDGGEAAPTYDVTVSDGALVDGPLAATISFTNVNDAPTAVADSDTVAEGNIVTIDLAANDTDPDDGLDLTSIVIVGAPTNGSVVVNADGTIDYTHDGSETTTDSFTYTIRDASGAISNTATVSLTITSQNDNPVLGNNALTISEGGTVVLTGTDLSATDAETAGGLLEFTVTGVTGGQFELVAAPGTEITTFTQQQITDGDVQFAHDGGEAAPAYTVTVSDGALVDGPLAATISFTNVNDVPTAVADSDTVAEGNIVTIDLAANDTDADDGLDLTSIVIVGAPTNGSVVVNADGTIDYTHDGSETTTDSFTYTIRDASGAVSNTATVSLTITPVDDNPVLGNNALTISEGGTVALSGADLSATDAETGDGLLQFTMTGVSGGQFELVAAPGTEITTFTQQQITDGEVQFAHDGGEAAPTYNVTVSDGALVDGPLAATISFTNVNDAPTAVADADTVAEGTTVTIDLSTNDSDPDDGLDLTSVVIVGAPNNGSIVVNADGTVDYTHDGSETVSDSFTYTIADASGAVSNTVTVSLTITPQDDTPVLGNNALTISEGGTVVLSASDLSATDAETASGLLEFTISSAAGGQFELVATPGVQITTFTLQQVSDGDVQFVHDGGEAAPSYDVTVSDGALIDGPLAATISFTNVNDAPTAIADSGTVAEGNSVTIDLALNDTDPDDGLDLTSIVIVGAPTNGSVIVNGDGTVDYTHDGSETSSDSFTYNIMDATGATSNTVTVNLTIVPVGDNPVLGNNALTIGEGGTVVLSGADLSATDAETASSLLEFTITGVTGGQFELVAAPGAEITTFTQQQLTDGDVQFVHDGGEAAPTYDVTVSDGALVDGPLAATITFTNVNDAPTAVADADTVAEGATVTIDLAGNDTDADDGLDLTSIVIVGAPSNGSVVVNADGTVDYTHDGSETVSDSFTYTIRDVAGAVSNTATVSLTITPVDDNPVLGNNALTISEGGTVVLTGSDLSATDAETAGGLLQFTITGVTGGQFELVAAPGAEITTFTQQQLTDGDVQFVHDGGEIAPTYDVTVSDGALVDGPLAATISFTNVNDVPTAVADSDTVAEGNTVTIDVAANDSDADDGLDLTSIVMVGAPTNGSVIVNADGTVDYTHDGSETIADSFTYTIQDASGAVSNTTTVSLTITPQDDNPILGNNALTITEGGTVILSGVDLSATDAETAGGLLEFTITGVTGGQFELVAAPGAEITTFTQQQLTDGDVQFVHDGGETAPTYDVTVSDGALVDGPIAATISFTNVNDAPIGIADADTLNEGATVTINLAANDTDADDGLDLTSIVIVGAPTNGSVIVNADGTVDYTHDGSETTADSLTYTIQDASGVVSNTTTVSLTITPQNDNPILGNNALTITEGGTVILTGADLSATDAETATGSLQFTITGVTGGQFELVGAPGTEITTFTQQLLTDGDVQFVHDGGEAAPTYDVTVSDGAQIDGPLAATISFTNVNDAPTAVADADSTTESGTVTIDLALNDLDPDDGLDLTSIVIVGAPTNGSVLVNADGTVDYTHDGSETIADSFTYTIQDASGAVSNTTTVTLTITPQNDNPVFGNNALTISEGGTVVLSGADLSATDAETGDGLLQFTLTGVSGGQFELVADPGVAITSFTQQQIADGDVQFVHDGGEAAPTYNVTVSDGVLVDGPLAATISFTNVNDAPTAVADSDTVAEGTTIRIDLAANDSDADDGLDLTSIVIVGAPTNGSVLVNADGTVDYTHDGSETIADSFTYTIQDASGAVSNTTTVSLTITPQDDNPVFGNNALTISEGGTVILTGSDLSATDAETAGGLLQFTITSVTGGQFELVAAPGTEITTFTQQQLTDGDVQFVHDGGEGAPTYDVTVSDGALIDGPLAATISFTNVNDAPMLDLDADDSVSIGTGFDSTFVMSTGPVSIVDADASITDSDDASLVGLDVTITNLMDAGSEFLQADVTGTSISASYDPGTGVLTLSGTDSVANYQQVLRTINYDNTSIPPDGATRVIAFVADDGLELSNLADSRVGIVITNIAPSASPDAANVAEGGSVVIDLAANDSDYEGALDLASIQIVTGPSNGALVIAADGTVTYTHDGSETSTDVFTYTIRDATGAVSNVTTATITIGPVNDAPTATDEAYSLDEDASLAVSNSSGVLSDESDAEGDSLSATLVTGPTNAASFTLNADGSFDYQPESNFQGTDSFSYVVGDGNATSGAAFVTLTVLPINDAPTLATNLGTTSTPGTVDVITGSELSAIDIDNAGSELSFSLPSAPSSGHLELLSNPGVSISSFTQADIDSGSLIYLLDDTTATNDSFSFVVSDSDGASIGQATFAISVYTNPTDSTPIEIPEEEPPEGLPEDSPVDPSEPDEPDEPGVEEETPDWVEQVPQIEARELVLETRTEVRFDETVAPVAVFGAEDVVGESERSFTSQQEKSDAHQPLQAFAPEMSSLDLDRVVQQALEDADSEMGDLALDTDQSLMIWVARSERVVMAAGLGLAAALLRAGSLMAMTASSVPIWKGLDPVAALLISDDRRKRLADEARFVERIEDETDGVGRVLDDEPT